MPAAFGGMRRGICADESAPLPRHDYNGSTMLNQSIIVCWTKTACQEPQKYHQVVGVVQSHHMK